MACNILVLAAAGQRLDIHDGGYPTILAEIDDSPLIERVVQKCAEIDDICFNIALNEEDDRRYHITDILQLIVENPNIIKFKAETTGSACTAIYCAAAMDQEAELLIVSANELVDISFAEMVGKFRKRNLDAGTLTFQSVHPRSSYVRIQDDLVVEAAQQRPISRDATAGMFWFRSTGEFVEAAQSMVYKGVDVDGRFFVAPVLNEYVLRQRHIGVIPISTEDYRPLKTERHFDRL
ncbi:MAG: hypothetical protein VXW91_02025, partial [Pseudomonadota bacterium]|nr:hypothetical protein [Pseudomonadota bacterium]